MTFNSQVIINTVVEDKVMVVIYKDLSSSSDNLPRKLISAHLMGSSVPKQIASQPLHLEGKTLDQGQMGGFQSISLR